ncbi:hypothetical protein SUGI_1055070 [Cryptomeria japonica]|uniref:protein PLANT CADMIUM RESISTANCE 3-like n=1 Tax=Cryptomeria japonica TaxID=3369 RepID=UPI00241497B6|nr:protein PLANT CADMIUM RESISTANCE 3-like [Cryptomeria japonica]GLJ49718.1 hypothetical protein SUGI_1055070 [Cryptomeria japonica]
MSAPKAEHEFQGYPPLPLPPQQIPTGYPTPPHQPPQNPNAQVQCVQPPPPQAPQAHLHYVQQPPPPQAPQAHLQYVQPPPPQASQAHLQYVQPPPPPPPPPYPSPPPQQGNPFRPTEWSSALCACTEDPSLCCLTLWCPCVTFGQIAEIVDEGSPSCGVSGAIYGLLCFTGIALAAITGLGCLSGFGWCYSCTYRSRMRAKFNLAEIPCTDCLLHCCCDLCALCQEYKELKHRGYEPALGWTENLRRQQQGAAPAMEPPTNPTMQK